LRSSDSLSLVWCPPHADSESGTFARVFHTEAGHSKTRSECSPPSSLRTEQHAIEAPSSRGTLPDPGFRSVWSSSSPRCGVLDSVARHNGVSVFAGARRPNAASRNGGQDAVVDRLGDCKVTRHATPTPARLQMEIGNGAPKEASTLRSGMWSSHYFRGRRKGTPVPALGSIRSDIAVVVICRGHPGRPKPPRSHPRNWRERTPSGCCSTWEYLQTRRNSMAVSRCLR